MCIEKFRPAVRSLIAQLNNSTASSSLARPVQTERNDVQHESSIELKK